jgi:hypothetical protein
MGMRVTPNLNMDRKLLLIRKADTAARNKFGTGGSVKRQRVVKPVSLPQLKFLERGEPEIVHSGQLLTRPARV